MDICFIGGGILGALLMLGAVWALCRAADILSDLAILVLRGAAALIR